MGVVLEQLGEPPPLPFFELKSKSKACAEAGGLLGSKGWSLPVGRQLDVLSSVRWDWNSMG